MSTTEEEFESDLAEAIFAADDGDLTESLNGVRTSTFEEAGVLTMNRGLVVRLDDGSEFQITIVKSR